MIRDKYDIYINKRKFTVPYYVMLCHATGKFKTLQHKDVYSKFLNNYIINREDFIDVCNTIFSYYEMDFYMRKMWAKKEPCVSARRSLIFLGWMLDFQVNYRECLTITDVINKHMSYSSLTFSREFNSIKHLNILYKHLASNPKNGKDRIKIYPKHIDYSLQCLGYCDVKANNILDDLHHHGVLVKYKDYFIWGSTVIQQWLLDTNITTLNMYNLNKDLGFIL